MFRMLPKSDSSRLLRSRWGNKYSERRFTMFVPVKSKDGEVLMPTKPSRARKWIKSGKATPYFSNGIFCVRLNVEPSDRELQDIVVGVDPGSKKEGFTVKSEAHTYLNVQADAHNYRSNHRQLGKVSKKIAKRSELRRSRRGRNCPNRKNRTNRLANKERVPAGTRVRWHWKLRILDWLSKMFPITFVCVEDIKARTWKGARKWNASFSPLEVGKSWFYDQVATRWHLITSGGYETAEWRDRLGLKKSGNKLSSDFSAHCVDSWVLANSCLPSDPEHPDNTDVFCISPIPIQRRNLHREVPKKGGIRTRYGGTMLGSLIKNTLVKHIKYGLTRVSGWNGRTYSLYSLSENNRLTTGAKLSDIRILKKLNFNYLRG